MDEAQSSSASQMRKGILEFCVLVIISKKAVYASEILEILKEAELIVVEGTLYPILSRLRKEKLLDYQWIESLSGPPRKYYSLTKSGKSHLKELKSNWKNLTQSIQSLLKNS